MPTTPMPTTPTVIGPDALEMRHITAGDSVRLGVLVGPESSPVTVLLEAWDAGGAQPPNSHPGSTELFVFLRGEGLAVCDDTEVPVAAGATLVLPPTSLHHIRNTGADRLYALTLMCPDAGFADLVRRGPLAGTDDEDRAVLAAVPPSALTTGRLPGRRT
ncbi:cupin domain-containing protein [Frankia sp. AgKG'84/4]|uniref:cupin domain-containing protein n=1 Tax=Frankia sp. AgKG'84/4 TaxID=573490 RepID=UPI00200E7754|nr:cupin domain-containing protein [Frankia sp. AgKG'84/4]MCL9796707.1 cupin domain-containing protein [Frankia sp. AgKG'84/4]